MNTHAWLSQNLERNSCLLVLALENSAASKLKDACLFILRMCAPLVSELSKLLLMTKSQLEVVMARFYFSMLTNKAAKLFLKLRSMEVFMV